MKDINLFKAKNSFYLKKVSRKDEVSKNENCDGFLINSSEKEARRIIQSLKGSKKKIAVIGRDDAFNRRVIESLKINYLISPEGSKKLDNLKQRDSGLNHVVAKIAKEKGIKIVINFREIASLNPKENAKRIARVMQNVRICRKVGCKVGIASFAKNKSGATDELGRKAFGVTIGMSSGEVRDCVEF